MKNEVQSERIGGLTATMGMQWNQKRLQTKPSGAIGYKTILETAVRIATRAQSAKTTTAGGTTVGAATAEAVATAVAGTADAETVTVTAAAAAAAAAIAEAATAAVEAATAVVRQEQHRARRR